MSRLSSLFKHKGSSYLPDFSVRAETLRPLLPSMGAKEKLQALIDVSKVWTYDYDDRKELMQELFEYLPKEVQTSLIEFLTECVPGQDINQDIPLALSQVKKEKLTEFATLLNPKVRPN